MKFLVPAVAIVLSLASGMAEAAPATAYSRVPEADALFLRAREYVAKSDPRVGGKLSNAREAIKLYQQAIKKDPQFALAYVEMSRAWLSLDYSDPDGAKTSEILPPARSAALKAVHIDPDLADGHFVLAGLSANADYNWSRAEHEYQRALELDPDNYAGNLGYGNFLNAMGRFDDALERAAKAESLNPSVATDILYARIYYSKRDYAKAEEYCRKSLVRGDNILGHFFLALVLVTNGEYEASLAEFRLAAKGSNGGALLGLAYGYAMSGDKEHALEILRRFGTDMTLGRIVAYRAAAVYLALGDKDAAFVWLNKERHDHGNWMIQLKVDPVMDPLRGDPRFIALMQKMHFT